MKQARSLSMNNFALYVIAVPPFVFAYPKLKHVSLYAGLNVTILEELSCGSRSFLTKKAGGS